MSLELKKIVSLNLLIRYPGTCCGKDPGHPAYLFHHAFGHFTVHVQDHDGVLTGINPTDLHAGYIDIGFPEDGGGTPDNARLVQVA